tara:strand:+ start:852 stop:1205 length:354 start_codon:yes stop_codon:yes gene_type:complete
LVFVLGLLVSICPKFDQVKIYFVFFVPFFLPFHSQVGNDGVNFCGKLLELFFDDRFKFGLAFIQNFLLELCQFFLLFVVEVLLKLFVDRFFGDQLLMNYLLLLPFLFLVLAIYEHSL